jgi:hypothetical protein
MSEHMHFFQSESGIAVVSLPFALDAIIEDWYRLRKIMTRNISSAFTRDEWAYILSFLDKENLIRPFEMTFGRSVAVAGKTVRLLVKPRGDIALWLPNNVSLLGPLIMILISLTGNRVRIKGGTRSENLTGVFRNYALEHLEPGPLKEYLEERTAIEIFDREDPRNQEMAAGSRVRIAFSSDETAAAIDAMTHPAGSIGIYFTDKCSEAWVECGALDDLMVDTLIKVFAVFGQAGCTSPRRVVIVGGNSANASDLKRRILERWPKSVSLRVQQHTASENIMARQWAAALRWDADLAENNAAVIAAGDRELPEFSSLMSLPIVWADLQTAAAELPTNIQTIGHGVKDPRDPKWLSTIAKTNVKRFVPIREMHHFGALWDGYCFWRQLFEEIEVIA